MATSGDRFDHHHKSGALFTASSGKMREDYA
jgi:hypothetical protein